jgi:GNAT superfamily N-acetyltransferase
MQRVEITRMGPEHLDAAARLVAERQERWRFAEPALPVRYADPATVRPRIAAQLETDGAFGCVALDADEQLTGFLLGVPREGEPWGRGVWVSLEASASVEGETMRDLYGAWSATLVQGGALSHYVEVPSAEPGPLRAWRHLGFAHMHEYGLRETDASDLAPVAGMTIRRATMEDREIVERLSGIISGTQARSPSYSPMSAQSRASEVNDYVEEIDGPDGFWLAVDATDGRPLGMTISYEPDPGLAVPERATYLGSTMTLPEERGRGVARALLRFVLERGRDGGATHCVTNWRTTNLLASRTWPRLGFRHTHHRLVRHLDARVAEVA